jgi:hypothetical protein
MFRKPSRKASRKASRKMTGGTHKLLAQTGVPVTYLYMSKDF